MPSEKSESLEERRLISAIKYADKMILMQERHYQDVKDLSEKFAHLATQLLNSYMPVQSPEAMEPEAAMEEILKVIDDTGDAALAGGVM